MRGGLAAQGDLRAVHAKHQRITARCAMGNAQAGARQKAELHQTLRIVGRKVQVFQNRFFAPSQVHQCGLLFRFLSQTTSSMEGVGGGVKVTGVNGAGSASKG